MTILGRASEWTKSSAQPLHDAPPPKSRHRYFAFLSYSHKDEAAADWLHDALESFRVPAHLVGRLTEHGAVPRKLTPVFRDVGELPASGDLGTEIQEALMASRFLIVLCSPAAANSRWTNAEIEAFKRHRPDGCIFAAVIAGEPFASEIAGRSEEECLPRALRFKYDRRGRPTAKPAEPLAADLRGDGDARRVGFLKLVAGLLGVGLDELVQREAMRRQRRLAIITAAALAGMVVTSTLAATAISGRDAARDQRREAEGLVGFMLGDLREKLEPVGRLDALDGVGSRVLDYYRKQDRSELSDAALRQRSRALALMGEIAFLRGDLAGALRLYNEASAGTADAVEREPDDPQRLFDHAQNVFWIGGIAQMRGQSDRAEAASREYKRLAERMVAVDPDNMKWRMEVQNATANLGIVLLRQRRFGEAGRQLEQALTTIQSLATADPGNAAYRKSYLESLAWLAQARAAEGRLGEATVLRERQIAMLGRLVGDGAGDVAYRQRAIPAHQALGRLLFAQGRTAQGIAHLRMAVAEADQLIPVERANTMWQDFAGSARLALAEHLLAAGNAQEAGEQARRGCDIVNSLVARDRSVVQWRASLRNCLTVRVQLALERNSDGEALELTRKALALGARKSDDDVYALAKLHRVAGDSYQRAGNRQAAEREWQAGLATLPGAAQERPPELSERVRLLQRLGRGAEASAIASTLKSMGYRAIA